MNNIRSRSVRTLQLLLLCCLLLPAIVSGQILVVDDLGERIELTAPAQRIAALSPHLAELVFAAGAGDQLVATVAFADYPERARLIPRVGSHNTLDIERLLAARPELVLVWHSATGTETLEKLRELGLKVYVSEPRQLETIGKTLRDIGGIAGTGAVAKQAADDYDQQLAGLRQYSGRTPRLTLYYQIWDQPLMTINGKSLVSRVIELCGAENRFASLPALAPVISVEDLVLANPEVFVGAVSTERQPAWLRAWRNWPDLDAVNKDNLIFIDPDLMNRPTPRILAGAKELCTQLEQVRSRNIRP